MGRKVTVVGAGPGGLAAAMMLARMGAEVIVLERKPYVGGRSATIEAQGFRFDLGPTFFLYPHILREIFTFVGADLDAEAPLARVDPQYHVVFEQGGSIRATADPRRMAAEIARIAPDDARRLDAYMAENRRKLAAFKPILERPFLKASAFADPKVLKALRWLRPHASVDADLKRHFKDPRVRLAFSFQSKYLGMSPFQCPSLFTILAFLEYEHGVHHPIGGHGALMEAMARVARSLGAEIRLGVEVEAIRFQGRRAVGVRAAGEEIAADAIVLNADFANAMSRLVPPDLLRRWAPAKLEKRKFSCSTFMTYLGIRGQLPELAHHTIWLAADYQDNLRQIQDGRAPPTNPSFYVQNACITDPGQAPPGCSALYVLVPVPHRSPTIDWRREAPTFRRLVFRQLERLGLANLQDRIAFEKIVTPDDWEQDMAIYKGATFNLAHSLDQMLLFRPRNRFEELDGVYLVGGGTHPGSGLPVIFEGARITARLLAEDLALQAPLPETAFAEAAE